MRGFSERESKPENIFYTERVSFFNRRSAPFIGEGAPYNAKRRRTPKWVWHLDLQQSTVLSRVVML